MESEAPLLLMSHGESYEKHLTYNTLENSFKVLDDIPILRNKRVFGSSYGWLVLVDLQLLEPKSDCYLWNPITMAIIQLPRLHQPWYYNKCILSKPPTEPDCLVLFNSIITQSFCWIGDEEFVELKIQMEGAACFRRLKAIGSFQSQIYGLVEPGLRFVTLHAVDKTLEFRPIMLADEPLRFPQLSTPFLRDWHLIESPPDCSGGEVELLMVQKIYRSKHIDGVVDFRVFRIDTKRMTCTELDNIGNRAIFLSYSDGGFCCCSSGKIKPNSVYYTEVYGRRVHVFDLNDGSTSSTLPWRGAGCKSMASWVQQVFHNYID